MGCGLSINISYGRWTKERLLRLPGPGRLTRFAANGSATPWQKTGSKKAPLLATNARNGAPNLFMMPKKWATRQERILRGRADQASHVVVGELFEKSRKGSRHFVHGLTSEPKTSTST